MPFLAPKNYFELYPLEKLPLLSYPSKLRDTLPKTAISKRYDRFGLELRKEDPVLRREYMQAYHACAFLVLDTNYRSRWVHSKSFGSFCRLGKKVRPGINAVIGEWVGSLPFVCR